MLKARLKASMLGRQERVPLGRFELLRACGTAATDSYAVGAMLIAR